MRMVQIANGKVADAATQLKAALEAHMTAQLAARVRRQRSHAVQADSETTIDVPLPTNLGNTGVPLCMPGAGRILTS